MARNLVKAGHEVTVWNRTRAKTEELKEIRSAASPAEAVAGVNVAITMLADDAAVESVVLGETGIVGALPKNAIHISCSTISVALSKRMNAAHFKQAQRYVAAPVFGRPEAAEAAKLFIAVAGNVNAIAECQPLFSVLGQGTFIIGDEPHLANVVKLTGNFMIATVLESLSEAIAFARKSGVDPAALLDFLTSTLFNAPVYKTYGGLILEGKFEPAGFVVSLGLKDIRLVLQAAEAKSVPLPIASVIRDRFLTAIGRGHQNSDWSVIAQIAAEDAGLSITKSADA